MKVTFYVEGATLAQQTRVAMKKREIQQFIKDIAEADSPGVTITLTRGVDFWETKK